jgi:hypothetical protein
MRRLGEILIDLRFVTHATLDEALAIQRTDPRRLGEILVGMGAITEDKLAKVLSRQSGVELWDPARSPVHPRVIESFPAELAREHRVFPVGIRRMSVGAAWYVATTDPTDESKRRMLEEALCTPEAPVEVTWFITTPTTLEHMIARHYGSIAQATG